MFTFAEADVRIQFTDGFENREDLNFLDCISPVVCLDKVSPVVCLEKLTKDDIYDLTKSSLRQKNVKKLLRKLKRLKRDRNQSFDKSRKERQQREEDEKNNKFRAIQEFLEGVHSGVDRSNLMDVDGMTIIQPKFKSLADIDRDLDTSSLAGSSRSEHSRPVRVSTTPNRYSISSSSTTKPKIRHQKKFINPNATYNIEDIWGMSICNLQVVVLVKWENYPAKDNTWEPLENVKDTEALERFLKNELDGEEEIVGKICDELLAEQSVEIQEYNEKLKTVVMKELSTFDPTEYKCYQLVYKLVKDQTAYYNNFRRKFRHMVVLNHFHERDVSQNVAHKAIANEILEKENRVFSVSIVNDVDFDVFPRFDYISNTIFPSEELFKEIEGVGCKCEGGCSKDSMCCPSTVDKAMFGYKLICGKKRLRLNHTQMIYECSDSCACESNCLNRVTQQPRLVPVAIFKTDNGRGWGLKAKTNISKGTYLMEYTGEIIDQNESNRRGKEYDEIGQSYMFDLDYNETVSAEYTIDAFKCGNISRLINHSCEPNCRIWPVTTCKQNPLIHKICYFSSRFIKDGEELTIDYGGRPFDGEDEDEEDKDEEDKDENSTANGEIVRRYQTEASCKCGSDSCRGFIFKTTGSLNSQ